MKTESIITTCITDRELNTFRFCNEFNFAVGVEMRPVWKWTAKTFKEEIKALFEIEAASWLRSFNEDPGG